MSGVAFQLLLAGGGLVKLDLLDHQGTGNLTAGSHTFSMNCGSGGDVVLCADLLTSGAFGTVTIGGVTATVRQQNGNTAMHAAIFTASGVPAGTQNVVINVSGGSGLSSRWGAQLYSIRGHNSLTPTQTAGNQGNGTISTTLNVPAGGAVLGAGATETSTTPSWTGITADVLDNDGSGVAQYSSGHASFPSGNASLSTSYSTSGTGSAAVWAVWGAA